MFRNHFVNHFCSDIEVTKARMKWLCKGCMVFPFIGSLMLPAYPNDLCKFDNGPCFQEDISLAVFPTTAASQTDLSLKLTLPIGIQVINAQLVGRDMYMGVIPVQFDRNGQARAIYGSCPSGEMVWQLQLELEDPQGQRSNTELNWLADQ
ncbi:MAG: hypothetical protein R3Y10_06475 [Ferrimonas sp.]